MSEPAPRPALRGWRRLAVQAGVLALRLLGATWRVRVVRPPALADLRASRQAVVYVFWHGSMLPCVWVHGRPAAVLVSEHRDGEIIARVLRHFGCSSIRGSTSRGGTRALLEAVATLKRGVDVGVTPDGPRGPREVFAPGALVLAHRAGAPVVTISAHASRAWRLDTWDRFLIPKPFARVTVMYGEPTPVEADGARAAAALAASFGERLQAASRETEALAAGEARRGGDAVRARGVA